MSVKCIQNSNKGKVVSDSSVIKSVGVIGSRKLPHAVSNQVGNIVEDLIATGGAIGADQ